jgi:uncharacterized RDD family membrane protein YckC
VRWRNLKKQQRVKEASDPQPTVNYANFAQRVLAFITDLFMIGIPISLVIMIFFGYDTLQSQSTLELILNDPNQTVSPPDPKPAIVQLLLALSIYLFFWKKGGQTPGKKMLHMRLVDAKTFEEASWTKLTVRFFAYFIATVSLIGFFTGLFRKDKRALHDLISGTAVIVLEQK